MGDGLFSEIVDFIITKMLMLPVFLTENSKYKATRILGFVILFPWLACTCIISGTLLAIASICMIIEEI